MNSFAVIFQVLYLDFMNAVLSPPPLPPHSPFPHVLTQASTHQILKSRQYFKHLLQILAPSVAEVHGAHHMGSWWCDSPMSLKLQVSYGM